VYAPDLPQLRCEESRRSVDVRSVVLNTQQNAHNLSSNLAELLRLLPSALQILA
jgi:hypothetical protein